eukprot:3300643-Rhodomonas_salina.1
MRDLVGVHDRNAHGADAGGGGGLAAGNAAREADDAHARADEEGGHEQQRRQAAHASWVSIAPPNGSTVATRGIKRTANGGSAIINGICVTRNGGRPGPARLEKEEKEGERSRKRVHAVPSCRVAVNPAKICEQCDHGWKHGTKNEGRPVDAACHAKSAPHC